MHNICIYGLGAIGGLMGAFTTSMRQALFGLARPKARSEGLYPTPV